MHSNSRRLDLFGGLGYERLSPLFFYGGKEVRKLYLAFLVHAGHDLSDPKTVKARERFEEKPYLMKEKEKEQWQQEQNMRREVKDQTERQKQ